MVLPWIKSPCILENLKKYYKYYYLITDNFIPSITLKKTHHWHYL
jgi:hypothetical protein